MRHADRRPLLLRWCTPRVSAVGATALGAIGLAGWVWDIPALRVVVAGFPAMSVNTALALLLTATALLALSTPPTTRTWTSRSAVAVIVLALVGTFELVSLFEYAVGNGWSLLRVPAHWFATQPSELISSPHTAVASLLVVVALALLSVPEGHNAAVAGQLCALAAMAVLLVVASGYLFSVPFFFRVAPDTGMALHTWAGLTLLTIGAITLRPDSGLAALWFADAVGSRTLRSLLPMGVLLVFLVYLLGVWGARLIQTQAHALSFVAILWIVLFALTRVARHLNTEEALRLEAQAEYREFFEGNPDAIIVADADGRMVQVNQQAEILTGYARAELIGESVEKLVPRPRRQDHRRHRAHFRQDPYPRPIGTDMDLTLLRADDEQRPVSISIRPARIGDRQLNIVAVRDLTEQRRLERDIAELSHVAGHDSLTGLPNRRLLGELLNQALAAARRHRKRVAVCYCDLDGFKAVNDRLGHRAGDALLREASQRMRACLRAEDTVARIGGDEFVVALPGLEGADDAVRVANKIVSSLGRPYASDGHELVVTVSVGISLFPDHGDAPEQLIRRADEALLGVKKSGKNQCRVYAG